MYFRFAYGLRPFSLPIPDSISSGMPRIEFSLFAYHNKYLAISNRGLNAFTRAQGVLALPDTTLCL